MLGLCRERWFLLNAARIGHIGRVLRAPPRMDVMECPPSGPPRRAFSHQVHKKSVDRVKAYWLRLVFSGREPPPKEMEDDGAVVASVTKNRGGLGYVAARTALTRVKQLALTD